MQNTTLEERMTGNYRDRFSAFQAAEAALRAGEMALDDAAQRAAMRFDGTDGTYAVEAGNDPVDPLEPSNYIDVAVTTLQGLVERPQLFIERLPEAPLPNSSLVKGFQAPVRELQYYRVTARGVGTSGKAAVVLQSTYRR
jgi:type IV pilus assembly protein PilX